MDEFQQTLINDFNQALQDNSVLETVAKYQAGVWRDPEGKPDLRISLQQALPERIVRRETLSDGTDV